MRCGYICFISCLFCCVESLARRLACSGQSSTRPGCPLGSSPTILSPHTCVSNPIFNILYTHAPPNLLQEKARIHVVLKTSKRYTRKIYTPARKYTYLRNRNCRCHARATSLAVYCLTTHGIFSLPARGDGATSPPPISCAGKATALSPHTPPTRTTNRWVWAPAQCSLLLMVTVFWGG